MDINDTTQDDGALMQQIDDAIAEVSNASLKMQTDLAPVLDQAEKDTAVLEKEMDSVDKELSASELDLIEEVDSALLDLVAETLEAE